MESGFNAQRLTDEEAIGWPLQTVAAILNSVPRSDAPLALVELQITSDAAHVITCSGDAQRDASCRMWDEHGHTVQEFPFGSL
jgi:hypothetical protein